MGRNVHGHRVCRLASGLYLGALFVAAGPAGAAELPAQGTLSGTVLDPDGAPFEGARIWVNTTEAKSRAEARTDRNGRFRLGPLESVYRDPYDLLVDADGFARQYVARGSYSVYPG